MEFGQRDGRVVPRQIDALLPKEMARRAERIGTEKAEQASLNLLVLGTLAGAFVVFGATFAAAVTAGADTASSPGLVKLVGGVTFSLAYVLAIVGGAELFTTNNLMVMAWAHGRLRTVRLLRAWSIVFAGNLVGTVSTAALMILAGQHAQMGGSVGAGLLSTAAYIDGLGLFDGFLLGILGNTLLCLGVWLTYSARTTTDRIMALMLPVAAFYVLGFEHAIAVMFYVPCAILIDVIAQPDFWILIDREPIGITLPSFFRVLVSVTAGNIVGGGVLVALVYWFAYLRQGRT